jgi:hypothetical protein
VGRQWPGVLHTFCIIGGADRLGRHFNDVHLLTLTDTAVTTSFSNSSSASEKTTHLLHIDLSSSYYFWGDVWRKKQPWQQRKWKQWRRW